MSSIPWLLIIKVLYSLYYLKMFGSEPRKQYYWQIREFRQCDPDKFKEMVMPQKHYIYLFKKNIPNVVVRIQEPIEKIHCWAFSKIEVLQRLNDNPKVFHWKHVYMPFRGELILSHLESFNQSLKNQIMVDIPRRTSSLQQWINADLNDAFYIKVKAESPFGNEHGFCEIKTLYRTRYKNYFQMRSWRASVWQGLLEIAETEHLQANSSYGLHLEQINNFISKYEVINNQHYQDMFELHTKNKATRERPRDRYQNEYERKVLLKYGLYEYMVDK